MKKLYSLLLFIVFGILSSNAQVVDETFKEPIPYKAATITFVKGLANGKILIGGDISFYKDKKVNNLILLNPDYSLDESFVFNIANNLKIKKAEQTSNGDIIVLGCSDIYNNGKCSLSRINTSGEILNEITEIYDVSSFVIQNDNKILVFGGYGSTNFLRRYNTDFTIDETFKNNTSFDQKVSDVKLFGNSIFVSGLFSVVDGVTKNSLIKLNSDGVIDPTFDVGKGSSGSGISMAIQEDGKILIGGNFFNTNENANSSILIRLNLDGTIDNSFSSTQYTYGNSDIVLRDSYIYIATPIIVNNVLNYYLVRLSSDGALDESFTHIKLCDEGALFFTSNFIGDKLFHNNADYSDNRYGLSISDLNGNILDSSELKPSRYGSFESGGYFDGKLVIKGDFVKINNVETFGIGLLDANGNVDESFVFPTYRGKIKQIQVVNNSVFLGTRTEFINLDAKGLVLKDFDFKIDSDLLEIAQFKVLDNGKILLTDQWQLVLLNEEGVQESKFTLNSDSNFWITNLRFEMQNDKVICAGQFESFGAGYIPKSKVMRFNMDKSIDESFNTNIGADKAINIINILDSGEIIIAGEFLNYNNISVPNQIVKLSKDGEMDTKFNENLSSYQIGNSQNHDYRKIEVIDGVIYITEGDSKITAINLDGTLKNGFEMPSVIDNITDLVALENKEKTSETGRRTTLDATNNYMFAIGTMNNTAGSSSVIVKLNLGKSSGSLSVGPTPEKLASKVQVFPVPVQEKMSLSFTNSIEPNKISVYSVNGQEVYSAKVQSTDNLEVDMSQFASGIYFIKLSSDSGTITKKIVKK